MKCIIFCAGGFNGLARPIGENDLVIAADGGLIHTQALGVTPHIILGDFDSLGYVPAGANVFPVEKDDTDAMLAVREGLRRGCREFYLYGCMDGPRLDHTVAAFQTLQYLADHGAVGYLAGIHYMATVLRNETAVFPAWASGVFSVFCMGPDAHGVTLRGLQYPLEDGILTPGFPLGVSNHFIGTEAAVTVKDGSILAIWDKANGFPTRKDLFE